MGVACLELRRAGRALRRRWDDPDGTYRVLYAASQRLAAFVEVLARFRPDPDLVAALAEIRGEDDDPPPGVLPGSEVQRRSIGTAVVKGSFADVCDSASIALLRAEVGPALAAAGVSDIDVALLKSGNRHATQAISRHVFERTRSDERPEFTGICYRSRHGDDFMVWAVFEHAGAEEITVVRRGDPIELDDPHLRQACDLLGIRLAPDL